MIQCDEQEEKEEIDEEIEDEEFIDEEYEDRHGRSGSIFAGRSVTLQMLLSAGLLQPGESTMAIEYLGQRFIGDLLPDGKIKSQETDIIFASPSAWAIHCKRIINPDKKSGCGWASVKYKGKKLDAYKNTWFKNRKKEQDKENKLSDDDDMEKDKVMPIQRIILKHAVVGSRSIGHDPNTLIESTAFSSIGKIQPFLVSMATNAVLVMDFHCHLTTSEVVGYLAGHWDVNAHNLAITHAFPCKSRLGDKEMAQMVEADIYRAIDQRHLTLVGWYHSHPFAASTPTLKDIDAQLDYQIRMKGSSDASYTPCIGVICSPYFKDSVVLESSVICYWVMPPPESKPHEYGKPMLMTYSVVQDQFLSQDALNEMKHLVEFYKNEQDFIRFSEKYKGNTTFLEKLKATLTSKFPRDQSDGILWSFIRDLVCPGAASTLENGLNLSMCKPFSTPEVPSLSSSKQNAVDKVNILVPNIHVPSPNKSLSSSSVSGNLMMNPDIASAIFGSGKFPPASALLGLSPDSGRSIIGSGNMNSIFASPLGFKMDNISIVKPLSNVNNNPLPSTSKSSSLATEVPAIPVKALPIDSTNFTPPESLEKNCTVTSGQT